MVQNKQDPDLLHSLINKISFNAVDVSISIRRKHVLLVWINSVIEKEKRRLAYLSLNFCSDKYLLKINRKYLNHMNFTDIITFDLSENKDIVGDVYISIERVRNNSRIYKKKYSEELERVIIHGVLHLCGYKDKTQEEISLMRKKEGYYLSLLE